MLDNSKKEAFIILIILLIGVLVIGFVFNYKNKNKVLPKIEEVEKNGKKIDDVEINEDYSIVKERFNLDLKELNADEKKYSGRKIVFTKDETGYYDEYKLDKDDSYIYHPDPNKEEVYTFNCVSKTCSVISRSSTNIFLIKDKSYYLIDTANKKYRTINNIDLSDYNYISLVSGCVSYVDERKITCDKENLYGLVLNSNYKEENDVFYNLLLDKITIDISNSSINEYISDYYLNRGLIEVSIKGINISLYDFTTGSEWEKTRIIEGSYSTYEEVIPYISHYAKPGFQGRITVLDKQLNKVFDDKEFDNVEFNSDTKNIYIFNNKEKEYYKYNFDTNNLKNIKITYEIIDVIENPDNGKIYEVVLINNIINLISENRIIFNTEIDYSKNIYYDRYMSGYYKEDKKTNKGIYLFYTYDKYGYMQKEIYYNLETGEISERELPVLLYDW